MHARITPLPPPPPLAPDWALFLDIDGTLLDFCASPAEVQVDPAIIRALERLHERLDGALALVSGRTLDQIDRLFAPLQLPAAGLHGLQRRDGADAASAPESPPSLRQWRDRAQAIVARYPGALVEDKGPALALHWRGNPGAEPELRSLAEEALPSLPGFRLQPGDNVVELRPGGADKGSAIAALLDTDPFRNRRPVFLGDDHTDEAGFDVVLDRDGIAVLVGDRQPSVAGHWLRDPHAVRAWLLSTARGGAMSDAIGKVDS
ncbi:MAG: trehalose-phosphatase [Pseudomonadota bacterium]|nr:trehalose-phosphatase [Pseudomonadota bacterium]